MKSRRIKTWNDVKEGDVVYQLHEHEINDSDGDTYTIYRLHQWKVTYIRKVTNENDIVCVDIGFRDREFNEYTVYVYRWDVEDDHTTFDEMPWFTTLDAAVKEYNERRELECENLRSEIMRSMKKIMKYSEVKDVRDSIIIENE